MKCLFMKCSIWLSAHQSRQRLRMSPAAGSKPKPLTPLGCKDLVAQCTCDSNGQNCKWSGVARSE